MIRIVAEVDSQTAVKELHFLLTNLHLVQDSSARAVVGTCALELSNRSPVLRQQILELLDSRVAENRSVVEAVLYGWARYRVRTADQDIRQRLLTLADSKDGLLATYAIWILAEQKDPALIPFFIERLHQNDRVAAAVVGLGNLGPAAKDAVPILQRFTKDMRYVSDPRRQPPVPIRTLAEEAIKNLQGAKKD